MNHAGQYRIERKKDPTLGDLDYAYDDNFYFLVSFLQIYFLTFLMKLSRCE